MRAMTFVTDGLAVTTRGMLQEGLPEIRVQVDTSSLLPECERFLRFVTDYLLKAGSRIKSGETMNFGYWLVKFQGVGKDLLDVWEYNSEGTDFVIGGSLALRYWRDQHDVCSEHQAEFTPPRPDKLTVVSAGVLQGLPTQGVRYPWQEHMSGWLLVTEKWDQDIKSLTHHHTYHVTSARPDLARFLALPVGFRFDVTKGERVWWDDEVARQQPL